MDKLLPTIRSRCSKVHFAPLPVDLVAQRVQQERKLDARRPRSPRSWPVAAWAGR